MPMQDGQLTETFLGELMAGMAKTLAGRGWDLMVLAPHNAEDELAMFKKIARARHVSGLVISRTYSDDLRFRILQELTLVSHGRSNDSKNAAWLDVDNELAFVEMTSYLASLGHRGSPISAVPRSIISHASAPMGGSAVAGCRPRGKGRICRIDRTEFRRRQGGDGALACP